MPKLTKRVIDTLKPGDTDRLIFDDQMPRFGIRVMRSGLKSYVINTGKMVTRDASPLASTAL